MTVVVLRGRGDRVLGGEHDDEDGDEVDSEKKTRHRVLLPLLLLQTETNALTALSLYPRMTSSSGGGGDSVWGCPGGRGRSCMLVK